jgi:hypothetical protein
MELAQLILNLISDFIKDTISWPVVVLIMGILFRKPIRKKIKSLRNFEGYGMKLGFSKETKILGKRITEIKKAIAQQSCQTHDLIDADNNPEIAIPRIYSEIEAAFKKKFGVDYNHDIPFSLHENKRISTEILIILDSMWALKENIHSTASSRKITREDIANYENNAKRIIEIIHNLEVKGNT